MGRRKLSLLVFLCLLAGAFDSLRAQSVSFIARQDFAAGSAPRSVAVGDFNGIDVPGPINTSVGTQGRGINSRGEIVGWFQGKDGKQHGYLRSKKGEFSQVDFPGASLTNALQINNRGDIVGGYQKPAGVSHGFLLSRGERDEQEDQ